MTNDLSNPNTPNHTQCKIRIICKFKLYCLKKTSFNHYHFTINQSHIPSSLKNKPCVLFIVD